MPFLIIDGFDHYGAVGSLYPYHSEKWGNMGGNCYLSETNPRRVGGRHLRITDDSYYLEHPIVGSTPGIINMGFGIYFDSAPSGNGGIHLMRGQGAAGGTPLGTQCSLQFNADGSMTITRGYWAETVIATSSTGIFTAEQWYWIELTITVHDSTGSYEVKINGVTWLLNSNVDTKAETASGVDAVRIYGSVNSGDTYIDDLYISDGGAFLGDSRVDTLRPNAVGSNSDWVPATSGADNYTEVDDDLTDDESTYADSGTPTDIDTYGVATLEALTPDTIHAVAVTVHGNKGDAGQRSVTPQVLRGSTLYDGDELQLFENYFCVQSIFETLPDDPSTAWDETEVNNSEFGMELTS